jgi:RNA polymerase sigma factor (sigma-70 family)
VEWLTKVAKHHKEWVSVVRSWGVGELSEDLVQEMYLRLHKYSNESKFIDEHGHVNKFYVYVTLRNMFHLYNSDKKKIDKVRIGDGFECYDIVSDIEEQHGYELIIQKAEQEIDSWDWYDRKLFRLYVNTDMSMRDIEKETNISLTSIFNTIKNCRARLNRELGEDFQDYCNGDFDRI